MEIKRVGEWLRGSGRGVEGKVTVKGTTGNVEREEGKMRGRRRRCIGRGFRSEREVKEK